jgi:lipoic acid synthetase
MTQSLPPPSPPYTPHPEWIRVRAPYGENYRQLKELVRDLGLHTVCEEAFCPNISECWGKGTATIMILGDTCTRACRFCAVKTGNPRGIVDREEPARVADAIARLRLNYVVITSVDRDDLPDGGAQIFAETVHQVKAKSPRTWAEILTPDFRGRMENVRTVVNPSRMCGQNIETARRLTHTLRDRAGYDQTLMFVAIKEMDPTLQNPICYAGQTRRRFRNQYDLLQGGYLPSQYLQPTHMKRHVRWSNMFTPTSS